jgi:dTDP-glucose pyrophosphorylase
VDTLRVIDRGSQQFALVVDAGTLVGLVTDGDIRRALMQGLDISAPIRSAMNSRPVVGLETEPGKVWRQKLREHRIRHLPIVDARGVLLRVVDEQSCAEPRDNWAVVMAGGLGTRLRPITEQVPKPMIEIGGTPILELILKALTAAGITRVFLAVNYRAEMIVAHFGDGARWGASIEYLRETHPMGTAGALSLLPQEPLAPLLVMNGDILTGLDYAEVLDQHARSGAAATLCALEHATQIPYGVVEAEGENLLTITEKPTVRHLASAGVYALSREAVQSVPRGQFFDMPALMQALVRNGSRVRVHRIDEYWIDIGRMDDLERARKQFGNEDK